MSKDLSRREFLETVGKGTAVSAGVWLLTDAAEARPPERPLPSRSLGRTGTKVSILAFGCGSRFLMYEDEEKAHAALNHAIDLGITYLDTAYAYGDGKSESRVGQVMKARRKEVWLATKIPDRTRDEFLKRLEGSLKRLQTDHVDLVHIHSLGQADDLEKIEASNGALKGLLEAREQKMAKYKASFFGSVVSADGSALGGVALKFMGAPSDDNFEEFELLRAELSRKRTYFRFSKQPGPEDTALKQWKGWVKGAPLRSANFAKPS
jgi:hypothetical protein